MSEQLTITLDNSLDINGGKIKIKVDQYSSDVSDAQVIEFVDGGPFAVESGSSSSSSSSDSDDGDVELEISKIGKQDGQVDEFHFDLSGFNEDFDISIKSEGPEDSFVISGWSSYSASNGVYTITYTGADNAVHQVGLDPGDAAVNFVCFTPSVRIETPRGEVAVENLREGDMVSTLDNGPQVVRKILTREARFQGALDKHRPVLIPAGCLGKGVPKQDLIVSPNHRVLLSGKLVRDMFGSKQVLAPAKGLLPLRGIRAKRGIKGVTYIALVLDRHEIVLADGCPCETLLLTPYSMASLTEEHRKALQAGTAYLQAPHSHPARPFITVRQTKEWASLVRKALEAS
ncbi:Hint domain-containing protein [Leisingera sp. McT4-56]|uniref:Hint domain-containing protein n=1 Tax=Leisingera sp. McT4-56 TaxID=2881255 RepID=UPI001CF8426A|nr:Hint domain-containing protein [Leisingera sp. McT4-56]MCB4458030.1 Hint domain-containing protein [Leisingera sp. McT4-56]